MGRKGAWCWELPRAKGAQRGCHRCCALGPGLSPRYGTALAWPPGPEEAHSLRRSLGPAGTGTADSRVLHSEEEAVWGPESKPLSPVCAKSQMNCGGQEETKHHFHPEQREVAVSTVVL